MKRFILTIFSLCVLGVVAAQTTSEAEVAALQERVAKLEKRSAVGISSSPHLSSLDIFRRVMTICGMRMVHLPLLFTFAVRV